MKSLKKSILATFISILILQFLILILVITSNNNPEAQQEVITEIKTTPTAEDIQNIVETVLDDKFATIQSEISKEINVSLESFRKYNKVVPTAEDIEIIIEDAVEEKLNKEDIQKPIDTSISEAFASIDIEKIVQDTIASFMDNGSSSENASIAIEKARNVDLPLDLREYQYIYAIFNSTGKVEYLNEYLEFIDEYYPDDQSRYSYLIQLAENYMMLYSPDMISEYMEIINNSSVFISDDEFDVDYAAEWNSAFSYFLSLAENFDNDEFLHTYNELIYLSSMLSDEFSDITEKMESVNNIWNLYFSYSTVLNINKTVENLSVDLFKTNYLVIADQMNTVLFDFIIRDTSKELGYSSIIEGWQDEISECIKDLDYRYQDIIISEAENKFSSIISDIGNQSAKNRYEALLALQQEYAPIIGNSNNNSKLDKRKEDLSNNLNSFIDWYYDRMYSSYQNYAARLIVDIKENIDSYEKKDKLEYLFSVGYFRINSNLLVGNLYQLYSGILTEDIVNNSDTDLETLQTMYSSEAMLLDIGDV